MLQLYGFMTAAGGGVIHGKVRAIKWIFNMQFYLPRRSAVSHPDKLGRAMSLFLAISRLLHIILPK